MNEREKLMNELVELWGKNHTCWRSSVVVDFILNDRKRIEKEYEVIKEKAWKYDQLCK